MLASLELDLTSLNRAFRDGQAGPTLTSLATVARARLRDSPVMMSHCLDMLAGGVRAGDVARARCGLVLALQIVADSRCRATATYLANRVRAIYHDCVIFAAPIALLERVHAATAPLAGGLAELGMSPAQLDAVVRAAEDMARAPKSRLPALMTNLLGVPTQASNAITNRLRARHPHLTGWFQPCEDVRDRLIACVARVWSRCELTQLVHYITGAANELVIDGVQLASFAACADRSPRDRYLDWLPVLHAVWQRGTVRTRRALLEALHAHEALLNWTRSSVADSEALFLYPLFCAVEGPLPEPEQTDAPSAVAAESAEAEDDDDDDDLLNATCARLTERHPVVAGGWTRAFIDRLARAQIYAGACSVESLLRAKPDWRVSLTHDAATDFERELTELYPDFIDARSDAAALSAIVPARTGPVPRRTRL